MLRIPGKYCLKSFQMIKFHFRVLLSKFAFEELVIQSEELDITSTELRKPKIGNFF